MMTRGTVKLQNPERFTEGFVVPKEKLEKALQAAVDKLNEKADLYKDHYPSNFCTEDCKYILGVNDNWIHGMHTGCYLLAYEATGKQIYLDVAKHHLKSYEQRIKEDINLSDHDVGFVYSPSCVAYYRLTGDEYAKELGLKAADILYDRCYTEKGGFILRGAAAKDSIKQEDSWASRTMMDTMMNAPLFFWRGQLTGEERFTKAALSQCDITGRYLIREDGSSNHHYLFELGSFKPLHGKTLQGNRDASTWTRGHSWGVIGYPIAWNYVPQDYMLPLHRDVTYYFLNHLPEDFIPYWDFDFISGDEPRDSSAAVIVACGLMEAVRVMPYSEEEKKIFTTAAHKIVNSVMDKYTTEKGVEYDGLLMGVTGARKNPRFPVEKCALYGDYFYLEALIRLLNPEWQHFW